MCLDKKEHPIHKRRVDQSTKSDKKLPSFTIEQVREHNKEDDCWMVINSEVYDVTHWVKKHPGGDRTISNMAGLDATDPFTVFHPEYVWKMLKTYHIGHLQGYQPSELVEEHRKLRLQMEELGWFDSNYWYFAFKFAHIFPLFFAAWYCVIAGQGNPWFQMIGAVLLALFFQQVAFLGHDTGHNGITHQYKWDSLIGYLVGNLTTGVSIGWWKETHNVHHIVTNSVEHDPDIQHLPFFAISNRFFKGVYSVYHKRKMHFDAFAQFLVKRQHVLYVPVMFFARFNLYAQSIIFMIKQNRLRGRYIEYVTQTLFFCWLFYMISFLPTFGWRLAFLILSHGLAGVLHVQITISHFSMEDYHGLTYGNDSEEFFQTQLRTSMNVDCPLWMDWFHGGLQFQIEHHLFPRLPRHNLRKARALIKPFCAKYGIEYVEEPWFQCIGRTIAHLKKSADQVQSFKESALWEGMNARG